MYILTYLLTIIIISIIISISSSISSSSSIITKFIKCTNSSKLESELLQAALHSLLATITWKCLLPRLESG